VRKLLYQDLNKQNADKILKILRKLNWNDPKVESRIRKLFCKTSRFKFSSLDMAAFLTNELYRYYSEFGIYVVDYLLENIRLGLETNKFVQNQQRISEMKFLGELYNFKLIDHMVVFDTLYFILTFGHGTLTFLTK